MEERVKRFGRFELDPSRHQLLRGGTEVHIGPKAFALLALLIEAAPRVVSKKELHARLWPNGVVSDATLVALVKQLRRALDDSDGGIRLIRTVHRVGYAFTATLQQVEPERPAGIARWLVGNGRRLPLAQGENSIGRDPRSDVHIDELSVSRRHARILVTDRDVLLEDLASKNGTSVGGEPVKNPTRLRDVGFGEVFLIFRASSAHLSTATRAELPRTPRGEIGRRRAQ